MNINIEINLIWLFPNKN